MIEYFIYLVLLSVQPLHIWYLPHHQHVQSVRLSLKAAKSLTFTQHMYKSTTLVIHCKCLHSSHRV